MASVNNEVTAGTVTPRANLVAVPGGRPDLDATLTEVATHAATLSSPIRLRLQPTMLMYDGPYVAWGGVSWLMELPDADAGRAFREALDRFIRDWTAGK